MTELEQLFSILPRHIKREIATLERITPKVQGILANDQEIAVKIALAYNACTEPEIIKKIATDRVALANMAGQIEINLQISLARHKNTPESELLRLADSNVGEVIEQLCLNPNLPESVMYKLTDHPISYLARAAVLTHPNIPKELVLRGLNDSEEYVRVVAQKVLAKWSKEDK